MRFNKRNLFYIMLLFLAIMIVSSCAKKINETSNEIETQLNKQFELKKGQTAVISDYQSMRVALYNVAEPYGEEARFVGLLNLNVTMANEQSKIVTFEMESSTAPRSYDVNGVKINYVGYNEGVAVFSVSK